jgi:FAD/FMN-containing dehydrogenase
MSAKGLILDLTCLDHGRVTIDVNARIARVAPGTTGAAINVAALPHRIRFAPDPSSLRFATSGGMVSTNASGARSYRTGSARRWVAGLDIVTAEGNLLSLDRGKPAPGVSEVLRFERDVAPKLRAARAIIRNRFPRTRKNSSGYALEAWLDSDDLVDLFIGAEGTLGVITGVRWALESIPESRGGLRVAVDDDDKLMAALGADPETGPAAVEMLDRTFLKFVAESLSASTRQLALPRHRHSAGRVRRGLPPRCSGPSPRSGPGSIRSRTRPRPGSVPLRWPRSGESATPRARCWRGWETSAARSRSSKTAVCPVERLADYLAALREVPARYGVEVVIFGHAGDGHLHVNLLPDTTRPGWEKTVAAIFEEVTAVQVELGGTTTGEHGDGRLRAAAVERVYGPEVVGLFRAVKHAFDPSNLLNPGVKLPAASDQPPESDSPISRLKVGVSGRSPSGRHCGRAARHRAHRLLGP